MIPLQLLVCCSASILPEVTRDLVTVIYHDFLVSETGTDAPVHSITLEQVSRDHDNDPALLGLS